MYTRLRDAVPDTHIHTHTLDLVVRSVVRLLSPGSEIHPAQTMGGPRRALFNKVPLESKTRRSSFTLLPGCDGSMMRRDQKQFYFLLHFFLMDRDGRLRGKMKTNVRGLEEEEPPEAQRLMMQEKRKFFLSFDQPLPLGDLEE